MFKFALSVLSVALFWRHLQLSAAAPRGGGDVSVVNPSTELVDVEVIDGAYTGERDLSHLTDEMIDQLIEDHRIVDIDRAVKKGSLKVKGGMVEYDTGDKMLHVSRKNSKTQMKIKLDPNKTEEADVRLHTQIDDINQEVELSHGLKKTIARFHASHLGNFPNGQPIGISQLDSQTIITNKKMAPGEKAISIKYYKGLAFHRPDGSSMRKHTLRVALRPKLLDKHHTRINVTIGDFVEGKQYMSVAGVQFLFRDDSARYRRCKALPDRCNITYTTTRKRVKISSPNRPSRILGRG